ncbi:UNVERIFIED_CONTAM: hypothetical protein K2H54_041232 [Gekko kuhli]
MGLSQWVAVSRSAAMAALDLTIGDKGCGKAGGVCRGGSEEDVGAGSDLGIHQCTGMMLVKKSDGTVTLCADSKE